MLNTVVESAGEFSSQNIVFHQVRVMILWNNATQIEVKCCGQNKSKSILGKNVTWVVFKSCE